MLEGAKDTEGGSNYDHNKTCKCGTELVDNENCFNHAYDVHNLICPKCKIKYIKCMRTGYLKENI